MKRYGGLYPKIYDFANLENAYRKARRGKRFYNEVLRYTANLEENLINLQNHLMWKTYKQGIFRHFVVIEPKKRTISALPFRDRVAQHAINNILEPLFDKRFYSHSYACREGKGTHRASATLKKWLRNLTFYDKPLFALKADISNYFATVDHERLKKQISRVIKDPDVLTLCGHIIDCGSETGRGIPVGNLTSQLFANIYLDALDKFIKDELKARHYIRYMDDFVILSHDKKELQHFFKEIEGFLFADLALRLNPKTCVFNTKNGVDFCGYRHFVSFKRVRRRSVRAMYRKVAAFERGKITRPDFIKSLKSWLGHIQHADTYRLRERMRERITGKPRQEENGEDEEQCSGNT